MSKQFAEVWVFHDIITVELLKANYIFLNWFLIHACQPYTKTSKKCFNDLFECQSLSINVVLTFLHVCVKVFFWTLVIKCKSLTSFFVRCYHAWRLRQIVGNFMETVSTIMFVHINSHCGKDLTFLKLPLLPFWTLVSFSAGVGIQKGKWAHKELKPGKWTLTVMRGKNKS